MGGVEEMSYREQVDLMQAELVLREFLAYPLSDGEEILRRFAALPKGSYVEGKKPLERYVYIPGSRKDAVLLVAHVDTVWDKRYQNPGKGQAVAFDGTHFTSADEVTGIGADDRAGCALLWLLRDLGHGILLLDGEEKGHFAAKYIQSQEPKLLRELNSYSFLLALDFPGKDFCHYHGLPVSRAFCKYVESEFSCKPYPKKFGSDLPYLSTSRCGVNIGIGYYLMHRKEEALELAHWLEVYEKLHTLLQKPQATYRNRIDLRFFRYAEKKLKTLWSVLRKIGKAA